MYIKSHIAPCISCITGIVLSTCLLCGCGGNGEPSASEAFTASSSSGSSAVLVSNINETNWVYSRESVGGNYTMYFPYFSKNTLYDDLERYDIECNDGSTFSMYIMPLNSYIYAHGGFAGDVSGVEESKIVYTSANDIISNSLWFIRTHDSNFGTNITFKDSEVKTYSNIDVTLAYFDVDSSPYCGVILEEDGVAKHLLVYNSDSTSDKTVSKMLSTLVKD